MKNRELKFRAWDKENKEMIIGNFELFESSRFYHRPYDNPNLILMQFTGLTDVNGKEIYEGDIVKITGCNVKSCNKEHNDICEVVFLHDGWFVVSNNEQGIVKDRISLFFGFIEVIGNIYQDKKLLNQ